MLRSGLVSVTFRKKSPAEIVRLVKENGGAAIEWGGDIHVPHGKVDVAREVCKMTKDAGLAVAAYGSYFYLGKNDDPKNPSWQSVLDSAAALEAPVIRVWAGPKASAKTDEAARKAITEECRRIGQAAAAVKKVVAFEYHRNSLTDTAESALQLVRETGLENVRTYWQPPIDEGMGVPAETLKAVLPFLVHVHVYQMAWKDPQTLDQRPLSEGAQAWTGFIADIRKSGRDHSLMLEFVRGGTDEQFKEDMKTLNGLLAAK